MKTKKLLLFGITSELVEYGDLEKRKLGHKVVEVLHLHHLLRGLLVLRSNPVQEQISEKRIRDY
jgi:hypothetical protein